MKTEFEWDPNKAAANLRKHEVAFEDAIRAFSDPWFIAEIERHVDGEERWQTIGLVDGSILLLVVHTSWEADNVEIVRIISARKVTRQERKRYEENRND